MPAPGDVFDGYTLVRRIGAGGFGEVWLCRSASVGDWRALKFIAKENGGALDREFEAIVRYRRAAARLRSPGLTPIEHVNRCVAGLYYVMPLADGVGAESPGLPDWQPHTLRTEIEARRTAAKWFSSREVVALAEPVLNGLQCLADAGLVHRDIKPDNILFFGGRPCLGDISLLTEDRAQLTRQGTPGYLTPSWYAGGHHDMYGAAALLYTLLTGNEPDRMGRSAFMWLPQGEASLSEEERKEWLRLHAVIRRATEERSAERYPDFTDMLRAVKGDETGATVKNNRSRAGLIAVMAVLLILGIGSFAVTEFTGETNVDSPAKAPVDPAKLFIARFNTLLAEDARVAEGYKARLDAILAFYHSNAPDIFEELNALIGDTPSTEMMEARLNTLAPRLQALVLPQLDMREDPLTPLSQDELNRRIAEAEKALAAGEPEAEVALIPTRQRFLARLETIYERASNIPSSLAERVWFAKSVAPRFHASPEQLSGRASKGLYYPIGSDNSGYIQALGKGELRTRLEKIRRLLQGRQAEPGADQATLAKLITKLDAMTKYAIWVELQTRDCYKTPMRSESAKPKSKRGLQISDAEVF